NISNSNPALGTTATINIPLAAPTVTSGTMSNAAQEISGPKTWNDEMYLKDSLVLRAKNSVKFLDLDNSNSVQIRAHTDVTESYIMTLPTVAPLDGQYMQWSAGGGRLNFVYPGFIPIADKKTAGTLGNSTSLVPVESIIKAYID